VLRRPAAPGGYARLPCWWSAERWLEHVERVYRRLYLLVRHQLVATTGGGISLRAVLAVATAHAGAANHSTGRESWPLLGQTGGERGLTAATGYGARTITRARTFLRLAGLATEIQPGRRRTLLERLDSHERGDKARGWTAVYALHQPVHILWITRRAFLQVVHQIAPHHVVVLFLLSLSEREWFLPAHDALRDQRTALRAAHRRRRGFGRVRRTLVGSGWRSVRR